jgi:hypothetical protein
MAVVATYPKLSGDWLRHENDPRLNREQVTIVAATGNLKTGSVLGKITTGAATSAAKSGGNTGNGAMGSVTVGAAAQVGVYRLRITKAAANAGDFQVVDPQGDVVGIGTVAVAFAGGGLSFTLADGASDFIVGDGFDITVAAGNAKWAWHDPTATNGAQVAAGILLDAVDASGGSDVKGVVVTGNAEIVALNLEWGAAVDDNTKKNAALAQLATVGFKTRQLA